jgi:resuscitation-promoting factor RpfA
MDNWAHGAGEPAGFEMNAALIAALATGPAEPAAPVTTSPEATSGGGNGLLWSGLAALLILGGIAAFLLSRRKSAPERTVTAPEPQTRPDETPVRPAPVMAHTPEPIREPAREPTPVARDAEPVAYASAAGGIGRHQRAALRGPTPDNPFLTRTKRMKRARFYDRRERLEREGQLAPMPETANEAAPAAVVARTEPKRERTPISTHVSRAKDKIGSITEGASWQVGGMKPSTAG